jgi:hypothetical protein
VTVTNLDWRKAQPQDVFEILDQKFAEIQRQAAVAARIAETPSDQVARGVVGFLPDNLGRLVSGDDADVLVGLLADSWGRDGRHRNLARHGGVSLRELRRQLRHAHPSSQRVPGVKISQPHLRLIIQAERSFARRIGRLGRRLATNEDSLMLAMDLYKARQADEAEAEWGPPSRHEEQTPNWWIDTW